MRARLWTNARITTMDDAKPTAEAILTIDDRIADVGNLDDLQAAAPAGTDTVDLGGAALFPGFIESHNHMIAYGRSLAAIDARPTQLGSIKALVAAIRERASISPEGGWLIARGYDDNQLAERRHPNRHDLDSVSERHPVLLVNGSGHLAVANTEALRLAGITATTENPQGGEIVRDAHGQATGLLLETAQRLVQQAMPDPTVDDLVDALQACHDRYVAAGITSSHTAGVNSTDEVTAHQRWAETADNPLRKTIMIGRSMFPAFRDTGMHTGFGDDRLRVGPLKLFSDGSLIGRTAAVSQPFLEDPNPNNLGMEMMPQEELDAIVLDGHTHGYQVAIHAIGDRAIEMCLDAFKRAQEAHPRDDARHRIEHCGILRPDLIDRLAREQVIPVSQPVFIREYGEGFIRHLGRERTALTYPFRSLLGAGIPVVFSSDCPVSAHEPLKSIQASVEERTNAGTEYEPQEAITPGEAIRAYTIHGARAGFAEDRVGTICPGMLADFTILARHPEDVAPAEIDQIPVVGTVIGGELAYQRPMEA
ncbi:MAG TPA: amidohydrolase [Thermomicrobiales bacterium]|nr:amidohydrolase [Thermomicrobiales bacterium]